MAAGRDGAVQPVRLSSATSYSKRAAVTACSKGSAKAQSEHREPWEAFPETE